MSSTISTVPPQYTVWASGRTVRGPAKSILEDIQRHARDDSEVGKRTVDDYATTLIKDAAYFFPDGAVPWFLQNREFADKYQQALEYLAAMPASGVHIISTNGRS